MSSPSGFIRRVGKVLFTFAGMCGWRLDRLTSAWIFFGLLSVGVALVVRHVQWLPLTVAHIAFGWAFYFVGNSIVLGTGVRRRMIELHGEDAAWQRYQTICAMMFMNVGFSLTELLVLLEGRLPMAIPPALALPVGWAMVAAGLVLKTWATVLVGVDIYYWRDMFLGRPVCPYVTSGPYRWFRNPMYGIGWLHVYGLAVLHGSWLGLAAVALFQSSIYAFYFIFEYPFVVRTYLQRPSEGPAAVAEAAGPPSPAARA